MTSPPKTTPIEVACVCTGVLGFGSLLIWFALPWSIQMYVARHSLYLDVMPTAIWAFNFGMFSTVFLVSNRLAAHSPENLYRVAASAEPVLFPESKLKGAIIKLVWTMDYAQHKRTSDIFMLWSMRMRLCMIFLLVVGGAFLLVRSRATVTYPIVLIALEVFGILPFIGFARLSGLRWIYDQVSEQHYGILLDSESLYLIAGRDVECLRWREIKGISETRGTVWFLFGKLNVVIPDCAFHNSADARAFVGTIKAMKTGKPAPIHDWSAYSLEQPPTPGVWPPAIKP